MKTELKRLIAGVSCLIALPCVAAASTTKSETKSQELVDATKWKLSWQDEFSEQKLDDTKWKNTDSDDPRLKKVENGILQLRGIENDNKEKDPVPYLTGAITSKGKYSFKYGKVQVRARFKCADGSWPALWMLGAEKGWPANGEIDLMEHLNFDDKIYQTMHSVYTLKIDKTNTPKHGSTTPILRDGWNTYG
jgi:beta-glucanase (GH16 family)